MLFRPALLGATLALVASAAACTQAPPPPRGDASIDRPQPDASGDDPHIDVRPDLGIDVPAPDQGLGDVPVPPDARRPDVILRDAPLDSPPADAAPDAGGTAHVHIYIDSMCHVTATPAEIDVPAGGALEVSYHNHSADYEADIWLSYGGGYLGLARGAEWFDHYVHCAGPGVNTDNADISIHDGPTAACPAFRFKVNCL